MNRYEEALNNLLGQDSGYYANDENVKIIHEAIRKANKYDEKEKPKKPVTIIGLYYNTGRIKCPTCNHQLPMKKNCVNKKKTILYCSRCGQKLDWEE